MAETKESEVVVDDKVVKTTTTTDEKLDAILELLTKIIMNKESETMIDSETVVESEHKSESKDKPKVEPVMNSKLKTIMIEPYYIDELDDRCDTQVFISNIVSLILIILSISLIIGLIRNS